MDNNLTESILNVCRILNKHSMQYLIAGGTAVALHGYQRMSRHSSGLPAGKYDLDFWYNPVYDNYFSLLNALQELGQEPISITVNRTEDNNKFQYFVNGVVEWKLLGATIYSQ